MMEIGLSLMACAVFAALTAFAVTAALRSARVDDLIAEVFSPWIQDPFAASEVAAIAEPPRSGDGEETGLPPVVLSTGRLRQPGLPPTRAGGEGTGVVFS